MYKHYSIKAVATVVALSLSVIASAQSNLKPITPRFELPSIAKDGEDYMSKTIIFKMKSEHRSLCSTNDVAIPKLKMLMSEMGIQSFSKIYPKEKQPERPYNGRGQKLVDLSLMYEYTYTSNLPLQQALDKFSSLGLFEYAEPHVIPKLSYSVNDPSLGSQYAIAKIKADLAWDISKGDTNMVIGITDTGTQLNHPDLKGNIKYNYKDKVDGIDNDNDGYIDNFNGWDVGMNDNDPSWQGDAHGVHVSGIAAASTDNNVGIAGIGFKCKFLPVKIANAAGALVASYTGIQYAANHGCKVINCSWGGPVGGSYVQDIINYVTFNKDALVVAAAGNDGSNVMLSYPGALDNVLCVANTDSNDKVAGTSNYGYHVSICAPGQAIYSTYGSSNYISSSGTSMASPCAAGAAAIVRSHFPTYTALQTIKRLRLTADNIYFPKNSSAYNNQLGAGRVNLYRALNDAASPFVSMTTNTVSDGNDDAPVAGDTLQIRGVFTNFLAPTTNVTATISVLTAAGFVTLIPGSTSVNLGVISTMGTKNNNTAPFRVAIKPTAPQNTTVTFKITYVDGAYTSFDIFNVVVNVDYLNVTANDIATSITSKGLQGWNNNPPTQGLGFKYNGVSLMYDGGFMIGVPDSSVSDVARGMSSINDKDFASVVDVRRITSGAISDFDTEGYMNDASSPKSLNVLIHHKSYAWSTPADKKYIMYKYIITNKGTSTLNNMYAGICADFDIQGYAGDSNRVSYDAANRMGYTWYTKTNGYYAGIKVLSNVAAALSYGFDNIDPTTGINPNAGFSNLEKYTSLSTMRANAGLVKPPGNDVMNTVSTGPLTLAVGDSVEVAFAIIGGNNLSDLKTSATNAQKKYDGLLLATPVTNPKNKFSLQSYPNPSSGITTIDVNLSQSGQMDLSLYNMIGQNVVSIATGDFSEGNHRFTLDVTKLSGGVYYYQLSSGENKLVRKLVVSK